MAIFDHLGLFKVECSRAENSGVFFDTRQLGPSSRVSKNAPSSLAELTAINSGAFLTPVNSGRFDGCQKIHPSSRPSSRPVNSGRELG